MDHMNKSPEQTNKSSHFLLSLFFLYMVNVLRMYPKLTSWWLITHTDTQVLFVGEHSVLCTEYSSVYIVAYVECFFPVLRLLDPPRRV